MTGSFDPAVCDLCGDADYSVLVDLTTGRSMRSDRRIINHDLRKIVCNRCGLVRSGSNCAALDELYREGYGE